MRRVLRMPVVMVLGLTPRLEGEEMKVPVEGFEGGDRVMLGIPQVQEDLLKKVVALGKPTVLVLLNGSAVAVNWAKDNVPAIVDAWYPGQAGGTAIADVLFGRLQSSRSLAGDILQIRRSDPAVHGLRDEGKDLPLLYR